MPGNVFRGRQAAQECRGHEFVAGSNNSATSWSLGCDVTLLWSGLLRVNWLAVPATVLVALTATTVGLAIAHAATTGDEHGHPAAHGAGGPRIPHRRAGWKLGRAVRGPGGVVRNRSRRHRARYDPASLSQAGSPVDPRDSPGRAIRQSAGGPLV
ncbi:hypothetical protein Strop_3845 [Salinispora tropica CNB-440]|uniref:Uncharacterized protein n=1 Tax=Salinispora tropica (strain ATCC BAA-916 / DSM 44818 / JCM 13857 / NBRC 105044 / CNB-440) TaxID=369723 RepID=A4XDK9_SALTO|nr:hypothetical protein Strop_3845 [Salinispora tropica CNB-440]